MLEKLNAVDWQSLNASEIPDLLHDIASENDERKREGIEKLGQKIADWKLLSGYGSHLDLLKMAKSDVPALVIPFLIELLENERNPAFQMGLIEILHYLSGYIYRKNDISPDEREMFEKWAYRIREGVRKGANIYQELLNSDLLPVKQAASDLLALLKDIDL